MQASVPVTAVRPSVHHFSSLSGSLRSVVVAASAALFALAVASGCDTAAELRRPAAVVAQEQKAYAMLLARTVLDTYFSDGEEAANRVSVEPASLGSQTPPAMFFVTLRVNRTLRASTSGAGATLAEVVKSAVLRAVVDDRYGQPLSAAEVESTRLEMNAFGDGEELLAKDLNTLTGSIEPGRHAIEIVNPKGRAFFKETVVITRDYSLRTAFDHLCTKANLPARCYELPESRVFRRRGDHWVERTPGSARTSGGYDELFRSHRIITVDDVRPDAVRSAARLTADYMKNHQHPVGTFDYQYAPHDDSRPPGENVVRQAGAMYMLSRAATFFADAELDAAARRGIESRLELEEPSPFGDGTYISGRIDALGASSLSLLALTELRTTEDYREAAFRLADGIKSQQLDSGRMRSTVNDRLADSEDSQQFFPGEALFALSRLMERWGDLRHVPVMEKAFPYYVDFWRAQGRREFVPWQASAWAQLYLLTHEQKYADFAFELLDYIFTQQNVVSYGDWAKDDYFGAINNNLNSPPNFSSGTHCEPMPIGITVALAAGDLSRAQRYAQGLHNGLRFMLQLVITETDAFYMPNQAAALGGVKNTLIDDLVRIDAVQHVGSALIQSLQYTGDNSDVFPLR